MFTIVITSYSFNFNGCNDANTATYAFVASPDIVLCPLPVVSPSTRSLAPSLALMARPSSSLALPAMSCLLVATILERRLSNLPLEAVLLLIPRVTVPSLFGAWDGKTPTDLPILIKVKVKCSKSSFWSFTLGVYSL